MTQMRPPQAPILAYSSITDPREQLREVAKRQKGIIFSILAYVLAVIVMAVGGGFLFSLIGLAAGVTGAVFVFMLAIKVYGTGLGVLFGLLTLIPLLGLIMLLIINSKATRILTANGIPVGLLGANLSRI